MASDKQPSDEKSEAERRKTLSDKQIRDLELAGGVEGGMKAGSAGGPGEKDAQTRDEDSPAPDGE